MGNACCSEVVMEKEINTRQIKNKPKAKKGQSLRTVQVSESNEGEEIAEEKNSSGLDSSSEEKSNAYTHRSDESSSSSVEELEFEESSEELDVEDIALDFLDDEDCEHTQETIDEIREKMEEFSEYPRKRYPKEKAVYKGELQQNHIREGEGIQVWDNGTVYIGEWK